MIDLKEIVKFIGITLNNRKYARKINKQIKESISSLGQSPEKGAPYPFESTNSNFPSPDECFYRKLVTGNYVVLYAVDHKNKRVIITNIVYARSDYQSKTKKQEEI